MRILVTGREGQVARALAERAAVRGGHEILFAARPQVDLTVPGALGDAIDAAKPDLVINAAAYTAVDRAEQEPAAAFRINAEAAGEAARAAARLGVPIIQLSTDYVFDGHARTPYREGDATAPINIYGASKLAGEAAVCAETAQHIILRTSWVVSPFGSNFVKTMLRLASDRDVLNVVSDQQGRPTEALDLADAILTVVERWRETPELSGGQTFHVANTGACSWADLAREVMTVSAQFGGPTANIEPILTADYPTPAARPAYSVLNTDKFEATFHMRLPDWRESVARLTRRLVTGEAAA